MAVIDPKKLLPESTKTTSILVPKKNVSISAPGAPALKPASGPESVGGSLVIKKLIKIDEVLKDSIKFKKETDKKEEKEKQKENREKKEKALETKKDKKKKADKLFNVPKGSGIDWLGNWLQWTVIGFLFNNLKSLIGYLAPIWNNVIKPLGKILYNVFTAIVSGVVTFIELGYNAYTSIEGLIGDLGGEDAKEEFNKATGALTTAFNVAIIGLMVAASTRPGGGGKGSRGGKGGGGARGVRPGTGGRPKVTTSGGGRAGGTGLRNPLRSRPKVTSGSGASRVTGAVTNRLTGKGAAKVTTSAAGKMGLRVAGRTLKPILGRLPIVGGLLEFLISWAMGDPIGKAAFRGVGATLFAALGGIIGSVVPVFGTAIGAALGGFAGGEAGGLLYDVMFGNKNVEGKVEKKQGGGQVGARKKPGRQIGRTKRKIKPGKVDKVSTIPGKDFGSKKDIEKFYGKDKGVLGTGIGQKFDTPFDALTEASEIAKQNRALNGVIGSLIGTGIDLTLGQKPSSSQINQISNTLSTFVQASMQAEMDGTVANIQQTFGLKSGGSVPSSRMIGRTESNPAILLKRKIESGIKSSIEKTSSEVFAKLRYVMDGKKDKDKKEAEALRASQNTSQYTSTGGGGGGASYGSPEMKALLDALAFAEGTLSNRNGATGPAGYSTWAGYQIHGPTDLTGLTIQEVHDLQTGFMNSSKVNVTGSAVVGRYQFKDLLAHFAPQAGLSGSDLFSPENQDKMAIAEINRVGITAKRLKEEGLTTQMINTLSPIWASFPKAGGGSVYAGQGAKDAQTLRSYYKKRVGVQEARAAEVAASSGQRPNAILAYGTNEWSRSRSYIKGKTIQLIKGLQSKGYNVIVIPPSPGLVVYANPKGKVAIQDPHFGVVAGAEATGSKIEYGHYSKDDNLGQYVHLVPSWGRSIKTKYNASLVIGDSNAEVINGKLSPTVKRGATYQDIDKMLKGLQSVQPPPAPGGGKVASGLKNWDNYGQIRKGGRQHGGLDIAAPSGTPLTAVADGVFEEKGFESGWGQFVVYKVGGSEYHLYGHLSKFAGKKKGDRLKAGEIIGYVGSTGRSTGPHLHWEMGSSWSGVIGGRRDPSKSYNWKLPFTVGRKTETKSSPQEPPKAPSGPSKFTRSSINSFFGAKESFRKNSHEGIDIEAPQGTKLSFSVGGKIIAVYPSSSTSKDSNGGYGAFVDLKLDNGKIIRMSHLSKIYPWVKSGATFGPNEVIALSGGEPGTPGAGRSGGPHIHFEQHEMSGLGIDETLENKVDPLKYGGFDTFQKGGTLRQNISSLQRTPTYSEGETTLLIQKELVMVG